MQPNEKTLLGGKVHLQQLEPTQDDLGLFNGGDERGRVAMIGTKKTGIEYVEYAEFASPGVVRGRHYHRGLTESVYVVSGSIRMGFQRAEELSSPTEWVTVKQGTLVTIAPLTTHLFKSLSPAVVICMGKGGDPFVDRIADASLDAVE